MIPGIIAASLNAASPLPANPDYYRIAYHADATGQSDGTGYVAEESRHAWPMTYNGNAQITSEEFVFDGTGDWIETTDSLIFTPGCMFTIEVAGLRFNATTGQQTVISHYSADAGLIGWQLYKNPSHQLVFSWSDTGSGTTHSVVLKSGLLAGVTYNLSICWDGSTVFGFVNGTPGDNTTAFTGTFYPAGTNLRLGASADANVEEFFLNGKFRSIMFTKGECLYTEGESYSVPASPRDIDTPTLTDALWPNVTLLVAYDETLGRIRDFGPLDLRIGVVSAVGNASGSISGSDSTMEFDGAGDYLSVVDDLFVKCVNGVDVCFDAVVYPTDFSHTNTVFNKRGAGTARDISFSWGASGQLALAAWNSSNTSIMNVTGGTMTVNTDNHIAGSLEGTTGRVFVNGSLAGSGAKSGTIGTTGDARLMGRDASNTARDIEGGVAWFRMTRGNARFTAGFTPPTGALPIG